MSNKDFTKQDTAFTTFLLLALRGVHFLGYLGIIGVLCFVVWVWKTDPRALGDVAWPAIGICILCIGSIWGANLLRKMIASQ